MTIIPIIIFIILIYQLGSSRLYDHTVDSNLKYLKLISNSTSLYNAQLLTPEGHKEYFANMLKDLKLDDQIFFVIDHKGSNIYSSNKSAINTLLINNIQTYATDSREGDFKILLNDETAFISYYYYNDMQNYYVLLTPSEYINEKVFFIKELVVIIIIIGLISIFSIVLISFYLTSPIRKLSKEMKEKNISFSDEVIIKDEIWDISILLNKVYRELKEQIDKSYNLEIKTNKAQFSALQSQINPHFLYNTLGTINSIAIIEKVPLIAELTRSLSNMFRYNSKQDQDYVCLKEEIEHIKNYLHVQLIRFEGVIKKQIDIEDEILESKTIKFMLQPLVENCFIHAFKDLEEHGLIRIVGYRKNDKVIINIEDNGLIMKQERLNEINELVKDDYLPTKNNQISSIGILNVNSRIKLAFGKEYGLSFRNLQPKGLCVQITLPFEKMSEEEANVKDDDY